MPFFGGNSGGGDYHLLSNDNVDGGDNVLALNTGVRNMALNNYALQNNEAGSDLLAIGYAQLQNVTNTNDIVAVGNVSDGVSPELISESVFVGNNVGIAKNGGCGPTTETDWSIERSVGVGRGALALNDSAAMAAINTSDTVAIGHNALAYINESVGGVVVIGANATASNSLSVVIGADMSEHEFGVPCVTIGNSSIANVRIGQYDIRQFVTQSSMESAATTNAVAAIPVDNTIPQSSEGALFLALSHFARDADNKLSIEVNFSVSRSTGSTVIALFRSDSVDAICSTVIAAGTTSLERAVLRTTITAGTTDEITFRVRAGTSGGGKVVMNASTDIAGTVIPVMGGTIKSSITVTEYHA